MGTYRENHAFFQKGVSKIYVPSKTSLYDRIMNANPRAVSNSSMAILDSIQSKPVDEQILGASVVFLAVCERFEIEPSALLNAVDNLRRYSRRYDKATFKGIEQYFKHEIN